MACRCLRLLKVVRKVQVIQNKLMSNIKLPKETRKPFECTIEKDLVYVNDPDTFGTLSRKVDLDYEELKDEGDIKEQHYLQEQPLKSQKLTTKQYADLIKQYLKHKRLKEAIDILEVRMLTEDRVKPENYIYNILIGACADVGYTKKAFQLFNEMKRRALKPTGDTYTCLFHACINSPWISDGLKRAQGLRELMIDKNIEPNLTNYNSMIKAFGRCGDLRTAFKIVDEMVSKKIKIRVHTFNHLLHACISDKDTGLRHALVVWRKMLKAKEKPNIYSFNLMLKCVKDCNLGSKEDIEELVGIIQEHITIIRNNSAHLLQIQTNDISKVKDDSQLIDCSNKSKLLNMRDMNLENNEQLIDVPSKNNNELTVRNGSNNVCIQPVNKVIKIPPNKQREVPNLLSKILNMERVLSLQEVTTIQEKFAIIGGQDDFLEEMKVYSVVPDIKTFTQMLPLLENTKEAENKLIEAMKSADVKPNIHFYNMLIKKRCMRLAYNDAFEVKEMIAEESKYRKKKYPMKKKYKLQMNIMTYGVLALACKTRESAEELLKEMKEKQLKVNIEILGTLLRQGTVNKDFGYIIYILNIVKEENLRINSLFIKHLEQFNDKCAQRIKQEKNELPSSQGFIKGYKKFQNIYNKWLQDMNTEELLEQDHPWKQFREEYPETVQRQNIEIKEPKRFYKRSRKFRPYVPKI